MIDVRPDTPNLETMLARFTREHWHDEDEVRFIIEGRGLFHVHPPDRPVFAIEVEAGDLIRVPRGTHHWFDLCADRRIRAIRLFQDPSGWTPHYTDSGADQGFQPVCFGPSYLTPGPVHARVSVRLTAGDVQAILLDVEGTTTPIAFVVGTLVPYARTHLRRYVEQHAAAPDCARLLEQLRDEHARDREAGQPVPAWVDSPVAAHLASAVGYLDWLMDRDRKSTALKDLQGRIWEEGYRLGELRGDVYADVPRALERWRAQGLAIGIFSSGSVLAQQLLFRHSTAGDLTAHLRWHFDTTIGAKMDADSYRRIAAAMTIPPRAVLFISDAVRELDAARAAGMQTRLSVRPGNALPPDGHGHAVVHTFDDVV